MVTKAAKSLEFHPIADAFPMMEGEAFKEFCEDIKAHGQKEPVYLYEGKVLDGRNRVRACEKAGIQVSTMKWDEDGDPYDFVISLNIHRRQMDASQRSMVAAKLATMRQGARTDLPQNCGMSQEQAAKALNVGERSVQHAKDVIEHGAKELVEAVTNGEVKVSDAAKVVDLPKTEQKKAVKAVKAGKARTVAAAAKAEKEPKAARGLPKVDVRKFAEFEQHVGKAVRLNTALKEHCGGAEFHEKIRQNFNEILKTIPEWRKKAVSQ